MSTCGSETPAFLTSAATVFSDADETLIVQNEGDLMKASINGHLLYIPPTPITRDIFSASNHVMNLLVEDHDSEIEPGFQDSISNTSPMNSMRLEKGKAKAFNSSQSQSVGADLVDPGQFHLDLANSPLWRRRKDKQCM